VIRPDVTVGEVGRVAHPEMARGRKPPPVVALSAAAAAVVVVAVVVAKPVLLSAATATATAASAATTAPAAATVAVSISAAVAIPGLALVALSLPAVSRLPRAAVVASSRITAEVLRRLIRHKFLHDLFFFLLYFCFVSLQGRRGGGVSLTGLCVRLVCLVVRSRSRRTQAARYPKKGKCVRGLLAYRVA
jgi:hypothetical protein